MDAQPLSCRLYGHARAVALAGGIALLGFAQRGAAADPIKIGGSGSALGTIRLLANAFARQDPEFNATTVPSLGSSGSIKALVAGAIGLAVISRPMRDDERKLGLTELEYGRTPFVFAVSTRSKVTAITFRQLADIYAGKLVSWPDGGPIRIVLRPASDIDTDMVKSLSPEVRQALAVAEQRPGVAFSVTDQDAANDIEKIAGAIGPSSLALLLSEKRPLRPLKLDGMEPTPKNIASGAYRYYKRLFLVTGAKQPAAAQRFATFIQSPAGRKILAQTGHWVP
jgi:phosphate transport system substrate-binding protein